MENTKELSVLKSAVTRLQNSANELIIASPEDYAKGADIIAKLKESGSKIKEIKESITKPLNDALKNTREMFKPIEMDHEQAEATVKSKLLSYKAEQDKLAREEEAKIARKLAEEQAKLNAKVAAGEITAEKAEEKLFKKLEKAEEKTENIARVDNTTKGKFGSIQTRKVKKVRIIDVNLVPRQYLIVDEVAVRRDALSGIAISGVEVYEEETLASTRL